MNTTKEALLRKISEAVYKVLEKEMKNCKNRYIDPQQDAELEMAKENIVDLIVDIKEQNI